MGQLEKVMLAQDAVRIFQSLECLNEAMQLGKEIIVYISSSKHLERSHKIESTNISFTPDLLLTSRFWSQGVLHVSINNIASYDIHVLVRR